MPNNSLASLPVTVIVTVLNEQDTVESLLKALLQQTYQPTDIILTDGGSTDQTPQIIQQFIKAQGQIGPKIRFFALKGNRSSGRNYAINQAKTELIAITDAGCIPHSNWLAELIKKQQQTQAPVVAGYYHGLAKTALQQAMIPYFLVMPDKLAKIEVFLPATRSMLLSKTIWQEAGGFDEGLSHNEDYALAKKLQRLCQQKQQKIAFAQSAVVDWLPPTSLRQFFVTIQRFAQGDMEAKILRPKVIFIFVRYLLAAACLTLTLLTTGIVSLLSGWLLLGGTLCYLSWAMAKNYRYALNEWYFLPILQIISDLAVMLGSSVKRN